jgi:AcrR family transcriptional regulator
VKETPHDVVTQASSDRAERRPPLNRDRVLRVAIELADRNGIEALSMRKLGQELGVDAMALYRHVRSKDDLFDGIAELIVGEIERPDPTGNWKVDLRHQVMAARQVMLRHPWARRVLEERGTGGIASIGYIESVLAILRDGGYSIDLAHHALHVLDSRIFGFNQDLFDDSGRVEPSPDVAEMFGPAMAARYPRVTELAMSVSHDGVLGRCDDDVEFAFGLDLILDGLDHRRDTVADEAPPD